MAKEKIITKRFGYSNQSFVPAVTIPVNSQLDLFSAGMVNNSGASSFVGLAVAYNSFKYKIFSMISSVFTELDVNSNIQIAASVPGDGLVIQAKDVITFLGFDLTSAAVVDPQMEIQYWNGAGWSPAVIELANDFTDPSGTAFLALIGPDFTQGNDLGFGEDLYTLKIFQNVDAGAVVAGQIKVGKTIFYRAIEDQQTLDVSFEQQQYLLEQGEQLIPIFKDVNDNNTVELSYRINQ